MKSLKILHSISAATLTVHKFKFSNFPAQVRAMSRSSSDGGFLRRSVEKFPSLIPCLGDRLVILPPGDDSQNHGRVSLNVQVHIPKSGFGSF